MISFCNCKSRYRHTPEERVGGGGAGTPILGQSWCSTGMCHGKAPIFGLGSSCRPFFRLVQLEKILLLNKYMFLCYFSYKPLFHVRASSESTPFSVRGRSLSPLFLNPPWHIYTTFISEYTPIHTHTRTYCIFVLYWINFKFHTGSIYMYTKLNRSVWKLS